MSGAVISKIIDLIDKHHSRQLRVELKACASLEISMIGAIGCPGIIFTVVNRGERELKLKEVVVSAKGKGFVAQFQQGFEKDLGHRSPSDPDAQDEVLQVVCLPMDKPNASHGWSLKRDEVARFLFPVDPPLAIPVATFNPDNVYASVITFDDEEREVLDGEQIQSLAQPLLDFAVSNKLRCRGKIIIRVQAVSEVFPQSDAMGTVNAKPVAIPLGEPWASDEQHHMPEQ